MRLKKEIPVNPAEAAPGNADVPYLSVLIISVLLLVFSVLGSLSVGRYHVSLGETFRILLYHILPITRNWSSTSEAVIMTLRLPRCVAAILIGSTLSLSGASYQCIFRNPMVSPDLLGVSSGACVGAAIAILLNLSAGFIQLSAFAFGIIAVLLTSSIPKIIRNDSTTVLILSGVIMSSLMSSIMSVLKFAADTDTKLAEITYWTMGSLAAVELSDILPVLPALIIPAAIVLIMRFRLNVLSLGDNEAQMLGVDLRKTRGIFIVCSTLMTASCVCLAGTIGWVGLVIPHISRLLVGSDNKKMLFVNVILGAVFMIVVDTLCRTLVSAELKLGILTGIIGAPFFFFILIRQNKRVK